jgi:ribonucleoside-diphosphate reductase alpha chain
MREVVENSEVKIINAESEINLSDNARTVLEKRYLRKNEDGKVVETPSDLFKRVAENIAQADKIYNPDKDITPTTEQFYRIMTSLDFIPNSPTLMNAGRKLQQLSACFVLPIDDSMESIFEAVKDTAIVHKSGGGTGFNFSNLRPKNDYVSSTYGLSSGPVSFMKAFDAATEAVNQGGFRRGANMGIMRIDHPDILEFIDCKKNEASLNNFNISVAVTDVFMNALENGGEYDLINPRTKKPCAKYRAMDVFKKVVDNAWENGEPGIIFIDEINRCNPTPHIGVIESTNPCGEQPLLPYEACNLGSINLSNMVGDDKKLDYDKLKETVWTAVHFLDNVIDMSKFPIEKISKMVHANRKIGLGVMGFADMLIQMGVPYNSEEALQTGEDVMSFINDESKKASFELAKKRGSFPNFAGSIYDKQGGMKIRNATTTTIAPTGSISIIANCSSGIEPLFALCYWRNVLDGEKLVEVNPYFKKAAQEEGFYSDALIQKMATHSSIHDMKEIPEHIRKIFTTAHDITPEWHIRMQSVFQKYTDNAVSKTVNFPNNATKEDVENVYWLAYKMGCKGVTVYRDGSRSEQVLNTGDFKSKGQGAGVADIPKTKKDRPRILTGKTIQMKTGCGPLYVTINQDEEGVFEIFNTMGKAGGCAASQCEAIGRLVSMAWRSGVDPDAVINQLVGISCHKQIGLGKEKILSCADAIAKAIQMFLEPAKLEAIKVAKQCGACPECGGSIEYEEGCAKCKACGYSECG